MRRIHHELPPCSRVQWRIRRRAACTLPLSVAMLALGACGGGGGGPVTNTGSSSPSGSGSGGSSPGALAGGSCTGGGTGYYMPFSSSAIGSSGSNGLFVIPCTDLAAKPVWVETGAVPNFIAVGFSLTLDGARVTAFEPYSLIYTVNGSPGVYALTLEIPESGSGGLTPETLFEMPGAGDLCSDAVIAQNNKNDPSTLFTILHYNTGGTLNCGLNNAAGSDRYELVAWDGTTSEVSFPVPLMGDLHGSVYPLYAATSGDLSGFVVADNAGNLSYFPDTTFSDGTLLTTGLKVQPQKLFDTNSPGDHRGAYFNLSTYFTPPFSGPFLLANLAIGSTLYLNVQTEGDGCKVTKSVPNGPATGSYGEAVWRVDATGAASQVYEAAGCLSASAATDGDNVYFTDTTGDLQTIYQQPIASAADEAVSLYSEAAADGVEQLIGSNGLLLVMANLGSGQVRTLQVGAADQASPTVIAAPSGGFTSMSAFMVPAGLATSATLANMGVFVNWTETTSSGTNFTSMTVSPSGTVLRDSLAGSIYLPPGADSYIRGGTLQIVGIDPNTTGGYDNGSIQEVPVISANTTILRSPSGAAGSTGYVIPKGDQIAVVSGISDDSELGLVISGKNAGVAALALTVTDTASSDMITSLEVSNSLAVPLF